MCANKHVTWSKYLVLKVFSNYKREILGNRQLLPITVSPIGPNSKILFACLERICYCDIAARTKGMDPLLLLPQMVSESVKCKAKLVSTRALTCYHVCSKLKNFTNAINWYRFNTFTFGRPFLSTTLSLSPSLSCACLFLSFTALPN